MKFNIVFTYNSLFANILKIKSNNCMCKSKQELVKFLYFKIIKL